MTLSPAAPAVVPVPADFPVAFAPGEEQLFWQQDKMHFPGQVLPLDGELVASAPGRGITHAFGVYEAPMQAMLVHIEHGYVFNAMVPVLAPPAELEDLGRRSEAAIMPAIARLAELWETRWLPEIRRHIAAMEGVDLAGASMPQLVAHLDDVVARYDRLWQLHMEIVLPAYLAVSEFDEFHRDLVDGETFAAFRLLQGIPTKTTEIGIDLWRLSRLALASPAVTEVLETLPAGDVVDALRAGDDGRAFLAELDGHLRRYGHRAGTWGLGGASFIEDPTPVVKVLKDYVGQPDGGPAAELARQAREREGAIAQTRELLQAYPAAVRAQFEDLLRAAQAGLAMSEDHNFWIDFYATDLVRQAVLELGRRFAAAGALAAADDILWLTLDEIRVTAGAAAAADHRGLVAQRRAELAAYADVTAPPVLGTLPPGPPPEGPLTRFVAKFWGPPAPASEPDVVAGAAGSAGKVTGTARVVRSLEDAERLQAGEILVAETTAPPWTPLFAVAAAVVTDTGGILSHCAVVAREYGIPAVVGAASATTVIADGDIVEVDGDAGTVRIVR